MMKKCCLALLLFSCVHASDDYRYVYGNDIYRFETLNEAEASLRSMKPPAERFVRTGEEVDPIGRSLYRYETPNVLERLPLHSLFFAESIPRDSNQCSKDNFCGSKAEVEGFIRDQIYRWAEETSKCILGEEIFDRPGVPGHYRGGYSIPVEYDHYLAYPRVGMRFLIRKKSPESGECYGQSYYEGGNYGQLDLFACPEGYRGQFYDNYQSVACENHWEMEIIGPSPTPCDATAGNPCGIISGNKLESEEDYRSSRLQLVRHYDSSNALKEYANTAWSHSYQQKLVTLSNGAKVNLYVDEKGQFWKAISSGSGVYKLAGKANVRISKNSDGAWVLQEGKRREVFSSTGRLVRIVEGSVETNLEYDSDTGLLMRVVDGFGAELLFEYSEGLLAAVVLPGGERILYQYDEIPPPLNAEISVKNLSKVIYPDNSERVYHYENEFHPRLLTGITDENGERFSVFVYDSAGLVIGSERAGGAGRISIDRRPDGTIVVADPMGKQSTYRYTAVRNYRKLASVEGGPCATCSNTDQARSYDGSGYIKTRTGFDGTITEYTRDAYGRELTRVEAKGTPEQRQITTQWHATLGLPTQITEPGRRTNYTYDQHGNRLTETVTDTATGESRTTTWTYNSHGQVLAVDGPRTDVNDVTTYTYDTDGNLATVTNALGHLTQYTDYDAHGNPLEIIDPNGVVTRLTYDLRQRLKTRTVAYGTIDAAITSFDYDLAGQLIKTTPSDGSWVEYEYDAAHRMTAIEDSAGNRIEYVLDTMGNRIEETISGADGAAFRSVLRTYNTLNRLVSETSPANNPVSYTYDAEGKRETVTDADNNTTTSRYDALDRLFETVDALNGVTAYQYDARDNLTQVIDPRGVTTNYSYNGFNELTRTDSPDAGTTSYTYDKAGNRITQTDARGVTVTYSYDALNRLTFIDYPGTTQDISYNYDAVPNAIGRLTAIDDETGRTEYAYRARGNLDSKASQINGTWLPLSYGYDIADRLASITYPDGSLITYQRDAHGRITGITLAPPGGSTQTLVSGITHAPFGPITALTFGNGLAETRSYDPAGRIDAITSGVLSLDYTWDATNNITAITDNLDVARNQSFDYDALYRLTDATGIYGSFEWAYDAVGNRTQQSATPNGGNLETTTYTYAATSNRLATITDANGLASYHYDANGNITDDGSRILNYDDRNRFVTAIDPATQQAVGSYGHNALGQRVIKTVNGVAALFTYDESGHLLGEYDANGNVIRQYVWLADRPVAMFMGSGNGMDVYYIHSDHLNTPQVVTDENQSIVWRANYEPYGKADIVVENIEFNLRFAGQYFDSETSQHYNYFRNYNPGTGRYNRPDPIGFAGGNNNYRYANASPVMFTDRLGLYPDCQRFQTGLEKRSWERYEDDVLLRQVLPVPIPTGGSPTAEPSLGSPKRPPVRPGVDVELWLVEYMLVNRKTYQVEQAIQTWKYFCTETRTDECGNETTYRTSGEYRKELDPYERLIDERVLWTYEMLRKLGNMTL